MPDHAPPGPVPIREAPSLKSYLVVGPKEVEGVKHGGIVELELTRAQENWLIEAGHIELAPEPAPEPPAAEEAPVEPAADERALPDKES